MPFCEKTWSWSEKLLGAPNVHVTRRYELVMSCGAAIHCHRLSDGSDETLRAAEWVKGRCPHDWFTTRRKCDWAEVSFCLWSRSGRRCPLLSRVSGRLYTPHAVNVFHPMKPNNSRLITSLLYHFLCPMVYLMKPVTGGPLGQSVTIFNHCHYRRNYFFITANRWRMKSQRIPAVGEKRDSCNFHLCIISTNGWLSRNFLLGYF